MRVAVAKKLAADQGMNIEYSNQKRLYILSDKEQGWPEQYFPGNVLRDMDEKTFCEFFMRIKPD